MELNKTAIPPPRSGQARATVTRVPKQSTRDRRTEAVNGLFQITAAVLAMTGSDTGLADAATIGMHGERVSEEIVELAATNEQVAKAVDYLLQVGPYGGLIAAMMPMMTQLAVNHKLLKTAQNTLPPDVLAIKMKAEMTKKAAEVMREAQEMREQYQKELASMQAVMAMEGSGSHPDGSGDVR